MEAVALLPCPGYLPSLILVFFMTKQRVQQKEACFIQTFLDLAHIDLRELTGDGA